MRVHTHNAVNEWIALQKFKRTVHCTKVAGNVYNARNTFFVKLRYQFMPVLIKRFIAQMSVCIKKFYFIFHIVPMRLIYCLYIAFCLKIIYNCPVPAMPFKGCAAC